MNDPDRFFNFTTPGAHEWWYFDAISDDGRDALVLVWYASLPFDPDYGVAALKHLDSPSRYPAPRPLNHCAVGISWYRDGKTRAYALNGFREADFSHTAEPFSVTIAGNRLARDAGGYSLEIDTPAVNGKTRLVARFRFLPVPGTVPFTYDWGSERGNHHWILAAPDCRVEGSLEVGRERLDFSGRGYHDHNADGQEISRVWKRWAWGRVHSGAFTHVYYHTQPRDWMASSLWVVCRDGRPVSVREHPSFEEREVRRNVFGMRIPRSIRLQSGEDSLDAREVSKVDDGPFYRRSLTAVEVMTGTGRADAVGISEYLDTANLNRRLFNWMIPYRLKRPGVGRGAIAK